MQPQLTVFFIITLLSVLSLAEQSLTHSGANGELNFNYSTDKWGYRSLNVGTWTILNLWTGVWWNSAQADTDTKNPMIDGDFMWGSIYVAPGFSPVSWFSYFGISAKVERNISNPGSFNWADFNVSTSSSFIASTFVSIEEQSPEGTVVQTIKFSDLMWLYNPGESNDLTNTSAGLYAFVFGGSRPLRQWPNVKLQYILTKVAGEINVLDGVFVYPRALESIISISDWQYQNPANNLVLNIGVGTLEGSWSLDGKFAAGVGDNQVYFLLDKQAQINGKIVPIKVGAAINSSADIAFGNAHVKAQLNSRYSAQASCSIVSVSFPANASTIVYDPTMGSGEPPFAPGNSSYNIGLIVGIAVGGVLLVVVIIVGVSYAWNRPRADYNQV